MKRFEVINRLIETGVANKGKYLEIGCYDGDSLMAVKADYKVGVDHQPGGEGPSFYADVFHLEHPNAFFKENEEKFDIIFIDGVHSYEQSSRDLKNALAALEENGIIIIHDVNPPNREYAEDQWCGEVFKTITKFREDNPDTYLFTVDTDFGVCVIMPYFQGAEKLEEVIKGKLTYDRFEIERDIILNLISVEEFEEMITSDTTGEIIEDDQKQEEGEDTGAQPNEEKNNEEDPPDGVERKLPESEEDLKELWSIRVGNGERPHHRKSLENIKNEILESYAAQDSN